MTGLKRWFAALPPVRRGAPVLRRVRVTAAPDSQANTDRALCVISPRGYRVEGLDIAAAAVLLRALA